MRDLQTEVLFRGFQPLLLQSFLSFRAYKRKYAVELCV
jgi:hypothetical protein